MRIAVELVVILVLASCGPQRRGPLVGGPVQLDTVAERRGQRLFFRHCSRCHPNGEAGLGPALNDKPLPEVAIEMQIRQGIGAMPSFAEHELSGQDVEAITEYVIALRRAPARPQQPERDRDRPPASAAR